MQIRLCTNAKQVDKNNIGNKDTSKNNVYKTILILLTYEK